MAKVWSLAHDQLEEVQRHCIQFRAIAGLAGAQQLADISERLVSCEYVCVREN